eukprot:884160-Ditylum_brightwellii.AAC.1
MMTQRNTDPRRDDNIGLIQELDEKTNFISNRILGKATGYGYESIRKRLSDTSDLKLPSKYCIDKLHPNSGKDDDYPRIFFP